MSKAKLSLRVRPNSEVSQWVYDEILDLERVLEKYRNGYQGACWCCESVGEKNVELKAKLAKCEEKLTVIKNLEDENTIMRKTMRKIREVAFMNDCKDYSIDRRHKIYGWNLAITCMRRHLSL